MSVGPYGGRFVGDAYVPQPASVPQRPQVLAARANPSVVQGVSAQRVIFGPPAAGKAWEVRRITVSAAGPCRAFVYVGEEDQLNLALATRSGELDSADGAPGLYVPEGSSLRILWWDPMPVIATARIEYLET